MIQYTDLELIAGVEHSKPATANMEFVCGYGGRYTDRDMSYQYGRSGANVESVALMAVRAFPCRIHQAAHAWPSISRLVPVCNI